MPVARSMFSPGVPAELNRKIVAEVAKYRDDPLGFVQFAFPWGQKGTPLERWPGPQMWQAQRLIEIGAAMRNPDTGKMHNAEIQEVKLIDRTSVLSLLMRHLGMNNDKLTIDVGGTLAEQLEAAMARRDGGAAEVVDQETGLTEAEVAALEHEERLEIEGEAEWVDEPLADVPDDMKGMI